ncbi:hypothetical protein VP01_395g1 [Puccinia sorghi]|uniref:Uncharacterized protein n=1 Tax=Puccinia sorghi TaxID=27349 RepID=A0A0L6UUA5_9BASI|nr:hypothetical protein VP01_395g1 [Puccinia sorghi]
MCGFYEASMIRVVRKYQGHKTLTVADMSYDHFKTKHNSLRFNHIFLIWILYILLEFKDNLKKNWMSKCYIITKNFILSSTVPTGYSRNAGDFFFLKINPCVPHINNPGMSKNPNSPTYPLFYTKGLPGAIWDPGYIQNINCMKNHKSQEKLFWAMYFPLQYILMKKRGNILILWYDFWGNNFNFVIFIIFSGFIYMYLFIIFSGFIYMYHRFHKYFSYFLLIMSIYIHKYSCIQPLMLYISILSMLYQWKKLHLISNLNFRSGGDSMTVKHLCCIKHVAYRHEIIHSQYLVFPTSNNPSLACLTRGNSSHLSLKEGLLSAHSCHLISQHHTIYYTYYDTGRFITPRFECNTKLNHTSPSPLLQCVVKCGVQLEPQKINSYLVPQSNELQLHAESNQITTIPLAKIQGQVRQVPCLSTVWGSKKQLDSTHSLDFKSKVVKNLHQPFFFAGVVVWIQITYIWGRSRGIESHFFVHKPPKVFSFYLFLVLTFGAQPKSCTLNCHLQLEILSLSFKCSGSSPVDRRITQKNIYKYVTIQNVFCMLITDYGCVQQDLQPYTFTTFNETCLKCVKFILIIFSDTTTTCWERPLAICLVIKPTHPYTAPRSIISSQNHESLEVEQEHARKCASGGLPPAKKKKRLNEIKRKEQMQKGRKEVRANDHELRSE